MKYCKDCGRSLSRDFVKCSYCVIQRTYEVTFVEETNVLRRRFLLLGAAGLVFGMVFLGFAGSIYNSEAFVAALDDQLESPIVLGSVNPFEMEKELIPKSKDGKNSSGGGAGSGADKDKISKGELPPQFREPPLLTPSKEDISVTDPALKVIRATRGPDDLIPAKRSLTNGDPNSTNLNPSNGLTPDKSGMGENGKRGIGENGTNGVGRNGDGGQGNERGNHYGDRIGPSNSSISGKREEDSAEPPRPSVPNRGIMQALKIIEKPRATYSDAGRENAIQGTVTLRVTFHANGTIGEIAVLNGLPNGLTEKAIAAARSIKFEPEIRNGVAVTVTRQIAYSFILY